jgi:hypothetical protein
MQYDPRGAVTATQVRQIALQLKNMIEGGKASTDEILDRYGEIISEIAPDVRRLLPISTYAQQGNEFGDALRRILAAADDWGKAYDRREPAEGE